MLRARWFLFALTPASLLFVQGGGDLNAAPCFVRGDANADGVVDEFDAVFILCYLFSGGPTPPCLEAANADTIVSNNLDITDAILLLQYRYQSGPPPTAPFPNCGTASLPNTCLSYPPCPSCAGNPPPTSNLPTDPLLAFLLASPTPGQVSPGEGWVCVEATASINVPATFAPGAGGWNLSIVATGPSWILSATPDPGLPQILFDKTEVTSCGKGLVSSVILGINPTNLSFIPPGVSPVLKIRALRKVSIAVCSLQFQDGQQCSGPPIMNKAWADCGQVFRPNPALYTSALLTHTPVVTPNTPAGANIQVCPKPWGWVTYTNVSTAGTTTAVPFPANPNFIGFFPFFWFKLSTTAVYSGDITVCIRFPCNMSLIAFNGIKLYHKFNACPNPGNWCQVPLTYDFCAKVVCGKVQTFSDFALELPAELMEFRRGDSNVDGRVDIADPVHILGCLFLGTECTSCPDADDSNGDGDVDIADPIHLLAYLFQGGITPPEPGPRDLGMDPVEDDLGPCIYPMHLETIENEE